MKYFVSFLALQSSRGLIVLLLWYSECHVSVVVLCLMLISELSSSDLFKSKKCDNASSV